jgi:alpha,alpha-trehalase
VRAILSLLRDRPPDRENTYVIRTLCRFAALASIATMAPAQTTSSSSVHSPADLYGPLFEAVQQGHVFADGKTFVDAVPKRATDAIVADYVRTKPTGPALKAFVLANFVVPGENDRGSGDLRTHVRTLWPQLVRQPVAPVAGSSALPLPAPYVVPGGRFREIYYWDSYFTMLGLKVDGQQPLVESMIEDFTSLIERYGHIPNGTRTYYLSRSQPPYYALMLDLSTNTDPAVAKRRLAALRAEHAFWMKGATCLDDKPACLRVVRMPDGSVLKTSRPRRRRHLALLPIRNATCVQGPKADGTSVRAGSAIRSRSRRSMPSTSCRSISTACYG